MAMELLILAAGAGTRMKSKLPKVLQPLAGKPLLSHVINSAQLLNPDQITVVYGHGGELVRSEFAHQQLNWVEQAEQLGTGHAVKLAMDSIQSEDLTKVLVLYGDVPLLRAETLNGLSKLCNANTVALLSVQLHDPSGYGRIVRINGEVAAIVEQKDASAEQLSIQEVNTGVLCAPAGRLRKWLKDLSCDNAQQEYYLTDIIAMAVADGLRVATASPQSEIEVLGINDKLQLAQAERAWQRLQADNLMRQGATLIDPGRLDIRGSIEVGQDVVIDANVIFEGHVVLGEGSHIGPFCHLKDAVLGKRVTVKSHTVIDSSAVGDDCVLGPYARLRPDTYLSHQVHIGNFVELKKTQVAAGSKINHLAYVGDAEVGKGVNVGAGTITCNYDGVAKHKTIIGDGAFIGSDTQLVAPVKVGQGAIIGAGSTITKDTPEHELTLSRSEQKTVTGWLKKNRSRD